MSLFEFTFGLQAIIFGLALTHLVVTLNRLVAARERVIWAARPLLGAGAVLVTLLLAWSQAWAQREVAVTTIGEMALSTLINLSLFAAAYAALPEEAPEGRTTDLGAHYERMRLYFLAMFAATWVIQGVVKPLVRIVLGSGERFDGWDNAGVVAILAACMAVRNRWVQIVLMAGLVVWVLGTISGYRIGPSGVD